MYASCGLGLWSGAEAERKVWQGAAPTPRVAAGGSRTHARPLNVPLFTAAAGAAALVYGLDQRASCRK
eukprot:356160-Chlamydomonas_euryale.AAC.6